MKNKVLTALTSELWKRTVPEGGFAMKPGGTYRTDATTWTMIALSIAGEKPETLKSARGRLAMSQLENGAVSFSTDQQDAIWTTPLAILAWSGSEEFSSNKGRAIDFLLKTSGTHSAKEPNSPAGHDTALKGWPWISRTHSWAEPTALSVIALRATGYEAHERVQEALRMLMDRQLTRGGWNFGSTLVFGRELYPMPETTGMALSAVASMVPTTSVGKSLDYVRSNMGKAQAPITLGWSLLGLSAYGKRPANTERLIMECFDHQKRYGAYDTVMLSLLIVAYLAKDGIVNAFKKAGSKDSRSQGVE